MGGLDNSIWVVEAPSSGAPFSMQRDGENNSLKQSNDVSGGSAVSFGFVATAVLLSMFLFMAILERFLRERSTTTLMASGVHNHGDAEAQISRLNFIASSCLPSPKVGECGRGVSVLMPGEDVPTFIAHPSPGPYASPS